MFLVDSTFWTFLAASILCGITVFIGLILFIVPGIIVAVILGYYTYAIVDWRESVMDSFSVSAATTKDSRWHILGFGVVLFLFNLLGFITIIGWLITWPVGALAVASVYRSLRTQPGKRLTKPPLLLGPIPCSIRSHACPCERRYCGDAGRTGESRPRLGVSS